MYAARKEKGKRMEGGRELKVRGWVGMPRPPARKQKHVAEKDSSKFPNLIYKPTSIVAKK
jgi:hypothetical protein